MCNDSSIFTSLMIFVFYFSCIAPSFSEPTRVKQPVCKVITGKNNKPRPGSDYGPTSDSVVRRCPTSGSNSKSRLNRDQEVDEVLT